MRHAANSPTTLAEALAFLRETGAPPRLVRHGELVAEVADDVVNAIAALGVSIDRQEVILGAALHDAGKIACRNELTGPGRAHEAAGEQLLRERGMPAPVARFCRTHGLAPSAMPGLEDLVVAVSMMLLLRDDRVLETFAFLREGRIVGRTRWPARPLNVGPLSTPMKWPFASKTSLNKLQQGNQRMAAKDYAAAIELFLAHAEMVPDDAASAFAKVAECYRRGNALPRPKVVAPGITLVSQGDLAAAEYYYRLALEKDPRHFTSLKGLADVLPERCDERLRCMEQAVDLQPDVVMLTEIGDFYRRSDPSRAYGFYVKAQAHKPKDRAAYDRLQAVCRELGRHGEAEEWAKRWDAAYATKRRVDGRSGRG